MQNVSNAETHRINRLHIRKVKRKSSKLRAAFERSDSKRRRGVLDAIHLNGETARFGDDASSSCGFGTLQSAQNL